MPVREAPVVPVPERSGGGLFGGTKRLDAENAQLREWVERLGGLDTMQTTCRDRATARGAQRADDGLRAKGSLFRMGALSGSMGASAAWSEKRNNKLDDVT
jgi:hypothetical protein